MESSSLAALRANCHTVVLDRDGVINHDSDKYIKTVDEWQPIAGSLEAIARLTASAIRVVIASNQSGIGRGLFSSQDLEAMHQKMARSLAAMGSKVDGIFYCPHHPQDHCDCRKPKAGLLEQIEQRFDISLTGQPLVGDSLRDLQAAELKHMQPILVKTGKGQGTSLGELPENTLVFEDLQQFVCAFIG